MYKIVLIGLGSIGKKHVDALHKIAPGNVEIYALRSNPNSTNIYKGVHNIHQLEDLDFEPDFFIISNPTFQHFASIQSLIGFEKPLFIEKPAVMHLTEAAKLTEAIAAKKITTYVACNLRFLEVLQFAKNYLNQQELRVNEVNIYAGSYMPDWRPHLNWREVYSANAEMGGGIHLDFIHEIDYLYWFFGQPKSTHKILSNNSSLNISAVDYANYSYLYENFVASVTMNYFRKDRKRTFEIVTDRGTLLIEVEKGKVYFDQKIIFTTEQTILDTYQMQMRYFINCLKNKTKPMNSFEEAYDVLKMCLKDE